MLGRGGEGEGSSGHIHLWSAPSEGFPRPKCVFTKFLASGLCLSSREDDIHQGVSVCGLQPPILSKDIVRQSRLLLWFPCPPFLPWPRASCITHLPYKPWNPPPSLTPLALHTGLPLPGCSSSSHGPISNISFSQTLL